MAPLPLALCHWLQQAVRGREGPLQLTGLWRTVGQMMAAPSQGLRASRLRRLPPEQVSFKKAED